MKTCQSSVQGWQPLLDQTVGSNTREGGDALVNRSSWDRYRLGHRPVISIFREGSMYSQAHISLFNIYWRVWLLVIREAEKAPLGSLEALSQTGFLLNTWHRYSGEENQSEDILLHVNY